AVTASPSAAVGVAPCGQPIALTTLMVGTRALSGGTSVGVGPATWCSASFAGPAHAIVRQPAVTMPATAPARTRDGMGARMIISASGDRAVARHLADRRHRQVDDVGVLRIGGRSGAIDAAEGAVDADAPADVHVEL